MSNEQRLESTLAIMLVLQREILANIKFLRSNMADSQALQFSDIKTAVTQLVNDNTSSNNAIAGQLKEVQQVLLDFSTKSQSGETVSQADYQGVIAQLAAIHSSVQSNTAAVQASTTAIQQADPPPATPTSPSAGETGSGSVTESSSSAHGMGE